jgi:hypothetical protein
MYDSVFIQQHIDMTFDKYTMIWEFSNEWNIDELEIAILKVFIPVKI